MDRDQYRDFLDVLFREYVEQRIKILEIDKEELSHNLRRLEIAAKLLETVSEQSQSEDLGSIDEYHYLLNEMVDLAKYNRHLLSETGIFEVLDKHLDEIAAYAEMGELPDFEREFLARLGSADADADLREAVATFKSLAKDASIQEGLSIEQRLEKTEQSIREMHEQIHRDTGETETKKTPWVEASGKIIRGVGGSTFNIAAGFGVLPFIGLPFAIPLGGWVIYSCVNGVGLIVEGTGKLLNK